jgi:hypothetical protein
VEPTTRWTHDATDRAWPTLEESGALERVKACLDQLGVGPIDTLSVGCAYAGAERTPYLFNVHVVLGGDRGRQLDLRHQASTLEQLLADLRGTITSANAAASDLG